MRYAFIAKKQTPAATTKACHHSWYPNHTAVRRGHCNANSTAPTV